MVTLEDMNFICTLPSPAHFHCHYSHHAVSEKTSYHVRDHLSQTRSLYYRILHPKQDDDYRVASPMVQFERMSDMV